MTSLEKIKQDIVNQLTWDSRVNANEITVKIKDGKVKLNGTVPTYTSKVAAKDITLRVIGVTTVENNLEVEFPPKFTMPTDTDIKVPIEQGLSLNADVDSDKIDVKVAAGIITLEGSVYSYWESMQAESEAQAASGVVDVVNKLAVVPTEKITDEVVGERIMDRISNNTTANVLENVDVKVKEGKAILTGQVPNWYSWRSVFDAAQFTTGVTEVEDKLNIRTA